MCFVYILKSEKDGIFYNGLTDDWRRRIAEHNNGWENTTKKHIPYKLIFLKEFKTRSEARKFEKLIKKGYIREKRKNLTEYIRYLKDL